MERFEVIFREGTDEEARGFEGYAVPECGVGGDREGGLDFSACYHGGLHDSVKRTCVLYCLECRVLMLLLLLSVDAWTSV